MSAPNTPADPAPRPSAAPERPSSTTADGPAPHAPPAPAEDAPAEDAPAEDAEEGARTPDEYTEAPGSHRRPSDGAALDVGG